MEDRQAQISRRRNRIEKALRRAVAHGLRFAYGAKAAHEVLKALSDERKSRLSPFSYDDMWTYMYFSDLRTIIDKHWPAFDRFFTADKAKVIQYLEHVDLGRAADAHGREISEEDHQFLMTCFKRLEEQLAAYM